MTTTAVLDTIFCAKPDDAIFLPARPYSVRFNCQVGQLALSESEHIGNAVEVGMIKVARYFGTLGKTRHTEWLQMFYIPVPDCEVLPRDTVCVSYIKTRSIGQFEQTITRFQSQGTNLAAGVFQVGFNHHANGDRNYYSVRFDWRDRTGEAETAQLDRVIAFMQGSPDLYDLSGTRQMVDVSGLSGATIHQMMAVGEAQPELTPQQILEAVSQPALAKRGRRKGR